MRYEQFCKLVERTIGIYLPEEWGKCETHLYYADKMNNVKKVGITFQKFGEKTSPTIYLEEFYDQFMQGASFESICTEIVKMYDHCMENGLDTSFLEGFKLENIKDKITMRMMNYKDNRMFLREVPHKMVDDLAVYYVVTIQADEDSIASMLIRDEHLEALGISKDELHQIAMDNTRKLHPPELARINDKLYGITANLLESDVVNEGDQLYVLTNSIGQYGAVNVLYPDIAEKAKKVIGEDYYILPSSLHEVLLMAKSLGHDPKYLGEMVREINMNQVDKEDRLSDHVYEMDFDAKEIRTVKESLPRQKEMER